MSGWIRIRHTVHGGEATVPDGSQRMWEPRGWEVVGGPADSQAELEPDEDVVPEAPPQGEEPTPPDAPASAEDETAPAVVGSETEETP